METGKVETLKCPKCGKTSEFTISLSEAGIYIFACSCGERLEYIAPVTKQAVLKFFEEKVGPKALGFILNLISKEERK